MSSIEEKNKNPAKRCTVETLADMFDRKEVEDPSPDPYDISLKMSFFIQGNNYKCKLRNEDSSSSSRRCKTHQIKLGYSGNDSLYLDIQFIKKDFDREFRIPKDFSGDDEALEQLQMKINENWSKAFKAIFKCVDKVMDSPLLRSMHFMGQTSEHSNKVKGKDKKNSKGPKKENRNEAESSGDEKRPKNNMNRERQENTTKGMNYPTSDAGNAYYFSEVPAYLYQNVASYYAGTPGLYLNNGQQWMDPSVAYLAPIPYGVFYNPQASYYAYESGEMEDLNQGRQRMSARGGANVTERATRGMARRGRNVPTPRRDCNCSCHDLPSPAGQEDIDYMKNLNISGKGPKPTGSKPRGMDKK